MKENVCHDSIYIQSKKLNHPQVETSHIWKKSKNDVVVVAGDVLPHGEIDQ